MRPFPDAWKMLFGFAVHTVVYSKGQRKYGVHRRRRSPRWRNWSLPNSRLVDFGKPISAWGSRGCLVLLVSTRVVSCSAKVAIYGAPRKSSGLASELESFEMLPAIFLQTLAWGERHWRVCVCVCMCVCVCERERERAKKLWLPIESKPPHTVDPKEMPRSTTRTCNTLGVDFLGSAC